MAEPAWKTNGAEIEAIVSGRHGDPFKVLGLHKIDRDWIARAFVPGMTGEDSGHQLASRSPDGAKRTPGSRR